MNARKRIKQWVIFLAVVSCLPFAMGAGKQSVRKPTASNPQIKTIQMVLPGHRNRHKIQYQLHRNRAIFQGDIDLGSPAALLKVKKQGKFRSSVTVKAKFATSTQPLTAIAGEKNLWPGGVVAYRINKNVPAALKTNIEAAIRHWNSSTNLRLVRRNKEKDFIEFKKDDGIIGSGSSPVGRQGGKQTIKLKSSAGIGTIVHEIGHSIGLWHEQSRMDRDSFVKVLWGNIRSKAKHNFNKHVENGIDIGPYDMTSIMHYGSRAFGKVDRTTGSTLVTLQSLVPGQSISPSNRLSALDIKGVNQLYPKIDCGRIPVLFQHANQRGKKLSLEFSKPNLGHQGFNDKASALCVPMGWRVTLFEHKDYKGKTKSVSGPRVISNFKNLRTGSFGWNDKVSSVRVSGVQANPTPELCNSKPVVFEHDFYRGRRMAVTNSVGKLGDFKFNDKISSICVPDNWTVTLYEHTGFKGKWVEVTGPMTITDFKRESPDRANWGDKFSSIRVAGPASNALPAKCNDEPVLFQHDNFRGEQLSLPRDVNNLHNVKFGDKASSVCVPRNWRIVLYEHKNYRGKSLEVRSGRSIRDLKRNKPQGRDWGDKVSSVRVYRPLTAAAHTCQFPMLYQHDNYRGQAYTMGRSLANLHPFGAGDKASSLCVPAGWRMTIYEHKNYKGKSRTFSGGTNHTDLSKIRVGKFHWGDKVSAVRVYRPAGVPVYTPCGGPLVYEHTHYKGKRKGIDKDYADLHKEKFGDKISSICVPAGKTLQFYEHKNFRGKSFVITGPRELFNLKKHKASGTSWNDKISSVKVR